MLSSITKKVASIKSIYPIFSASYHDHVISRFENPTNVGSLDAKQKNVGTGLAGHPACGDIMKLQVEVGEDGKISKAVFKTYGCGSAIASSQYATEMLQGMTLDEAESIQNGDIAGYLKLPPVKLHCSLLAEDAIKKALKDLRKKTDSPEVQELERATAAKSV